MSELTTRERFVRTLLGQDTDRVPFMKCFGGDDAVLPKWEEENPGLRTYIDELLQFEGGYRGWRITPVNFWLCGDIHSRVIHEDEAYIIREYNYGMKEKVSKHGDFHAHTIEYPVKTQNDWDRIKSLYLNPDDPNRIPRDWDNYVELYRNREFPLQLTYGGVYGFARQMMGDEGLLSRQSPGAHPALAAKGVHANQERDHPGSGAASAGRSYLRGTGSG